MQKREAMASRGPRKVQVEGLLDLADLTQNHAEIRGDSLERRRIWRFSTKTTLANC